VKEQANVEMQNDSFSYMMNRDLSWLQFNKRVLNEAADVGIPIVDRLRFLSIFTNNLDEFFMIRIGSLFDIINVKKDAIDMRTGRLMSLVLKDIYKEVRPMIVKLDRVYRKTIANLKKYKIEVVAIDDLTPAEKELVKKYFENEIQPILSPQVIDAHHPFPHVLTKVANIGLKLEHKDKNYFGMIPIPSSLPELYLPHPDVPRYVRVEDLILYFAPHVFRMYHVLEKTVFCVTRNADLNFYDEIIDDATNVRVKIKQILNTRRTLKPVRLELSTQVSDDFFQYLLDRFEIKRYQVFVTSTPMKLDFLNALVKPKSIASDSTMVHPPYQPVWPQAISKSESMLDQIQKQDFLLHFPYDSMEPYLKLMKEAADHPDVISIKITIYRLAKTAKLIEYLSRAAENGKDVLVIIELRARFDEQNNIDWSERLEKAGCKIIYGLDIFKVHSKVTLITMKQHQQLVYITQVGTGNFNERTVEQYEDLSLMTANRDIGSDIVAFFTNLSIVNVEGEYQHILVSPKLLKRRIIECIHEETLKQDRGLIRMKLNAITDVDFMAALVEASKANVHIELVVRSICCIRPQIEKATEHVFVRSIVGRFLEHARIYSFGRDDEQKIYISSADMMTRNTERRVEVACPIYQADCIAMINKILDYNWKDNTKSRRIDVHGKHVMDETTDPTFNAQEQFMLEKNESR
jgi:polyphosphate kinase